MNDLDSLMPRVIEQIYNVLSHEIKMGLWDGRDDSGGIYSFQFLQALHEDYMINLHKLLEMTNFKFDDGVNQDKNILSKYLVLMNAKKSQLSQSWLTLRHFMIYIYRSLLSFNPQTDCEEISVHFIAEMKNLVKELSRADETQLYLRIFSLLHTFVSFTLCQFNKSLDNDGSTLERLYQYYHTFLIASKRIYPAFMDLEMLLRDKCNMSWMDYNKFVFFNIFYQAIDSEILAKDQLKVPAVYNSMIIDFEELNTLWQTLKNLRGINQNMDNEMGEDHKLILKNNFWIHRNKTEDKHSIQRLAAELIILASDRRSNSGTRNYEPYFNREGQCLCEDCLLCMIALQIDFKKPLLNSTFNLLPCRFCPKGIDLNCFHDHVVGHLKRNTIMLDLLESPLKSKASDVSTDIHKKLDDVENREFKNGVNKSQSLLSLLKKVKPVKCAEAKIELAARLTEKKSEIVSNGDTKEKCRVPHIRNESSSKNTSSCSLSCKQEEELKAELKKLQGVCDHHKDSKKCDCTYCEVFGSSAAASKKKHSNNETRTRLRIRLNQRNQRQKTVVVESNRKSGSKNTSSSNSVIIPNKTTTSSARIEPEAQIENQFANMRLSNIDSAKYVVETSNKVSKVKACDAVTAATKTSENKLNDIHGLIDYIEGNSGSDKAAIAEKKAAKKARQRQRKEEERKKLEDDRIIDEVEKKRTTELQLRLTKQIGQKNVDIEANKKLKKSKSNKNKTEDDVIMNEFLEETIPAMITITKSIENGDNRPTITITLKGSTPDQDKLLSTLINSQSDVSKEKVSNKSKKSRKPVQQKLEQLVKVQILRKETGKITNGKCNNFNSTNTNKEVKVSFTVNNKTHNEHNSITKSAEVEKIKVPPKSQNTKSKELDLPFFKLPPGITITKIDGPSSNKNDYRIAMNDHSDNSNNIPVNKSGVIVVDTEKLINSNENSKETNRKSRKKKSKKQKLTTVPAITLGKAAPSMVTLKNPIFKSLSESVGRQQQQQEHPLPIDIGGTSCGGQASIFRNENGMVTIRSSRLQQSINNGGSGTGIPVHCVLSDLKPVIGPGGEAENLHSSSSNKNSAVTSTSSNMTCFNAQEILSGLPGIEITKVNKNSLKAEQDSKNINQVAQVSIIPTNGDKSNFDKDDWSYDNIFTPKDVLEDDLDAEERELEAFKRFCQQSIPPKQKEKVAHLNVHDIVLKKKNDTYLP